MLDSLLAFYVSHATTVWLILGFILVAAELTVVAGIGLLFAGLGALTVGALLAFDLLLATRVEWQFILFCGFTLGWTCVLWKPVKRYLNASTQYDIYSGTTASVQRATLEKHTIGLVRWSGTEMRARIRPEAIEDSIAVGTHVFIHNMQDGILLVDTQPPTQDSQGD